MNIKICVNDDSVFDPFSMKCVYLSKSKQMNCVFHIFSIDCGQCSLNSLSAIESIDFSLAISSDVNSTGVDLCANG